ncbi:MAG: InlB B-repeat-containing protein [Oscillospiraceae bacterium]|nr:InlB B-repeat-containing protein [Oscillospiraceae bacterium]
MKKRILSVFLTLAMVMSFALLPNSELVLTASANDAERNYGILPFNEKARFPTDPNNPESALSYPGLGENIGTNIFEIDLKVPGDLRIEIDIPRLTTGWRDTSALPSWAAADLTKPDGDPARNGLGATFTLRDSNNSIVQSYNKEPIIIPQQINSIPGWCYCQCPPENPECQPQPCVHKCGTGVCSDPLFFEINNLAAGKYRIEIEALEGTQTSANTGTYNIIAEYFIEGTDADNRASSPIEIVPGVTVLSEMTGTSTADAVGHVYELDLETPGRLTVYMAGGHNGASRFRSSMGEGTAQADNGRYMPIDEDAIDYRGLRIQARAGGNTFNSSTVLMTAGNPVGLVAGPPVAAHWSQHPVPSALVASTWINAPYVAVLDLEAGKNYIQISNAAQTANVNPTGTYSLRTEFLPHEGLSADRKINLAFPNTIDPYLDITAPAVAPQYHTKINLTAGGTNVYDSFLSTRNFADVYVFEVPAGGGVVTAELKSPVSAYSTNTANSARVNPANLPGATIHPGQGGIGTGSAAPPSLLWRNSDGEIISGTGIAIAVAGLGGTSDSSYNTQVGLAAGTYYLEVRRRGHITDTTQNTGKYSLTLGFENASTAFTGGARVFNDLASPGIRSMGFGDVATGLISVDDDGFTTHRDIYQYQVTQAGILAVTARSANKGGLPNQGVDLLVRCNVPGSPPIIAAYTTAKADTTSGFNFEEYHYAVEPGTYQIELRQRNRALGTSGDRTATQTQMDNRQINNNNSGIYEISAVMQPFPVNENEPNNERYNADLLFHPTDSTALHKVNAMLSLTDDRDVFRIVITEPGRVEVDISHPFVFGGLSHHNTNHPIDIKWYREIEGQAGLGTQFHSASFSVSAATNKHYRDLELPGVYYFVIEKRPIPMGTPQDPWDGHNSAQAGTYMLEARFTPAQNTNNPGINTRANAQDIRHSQPMVGLMNHPHTVLPGGTLIGNWNIHSQWYKYELAQPGDLIINLFTADTPIPMATGSLGIRIYSGNDTTAVTGGAIETNMPIRGRTLTNRPAGTYYIEIYRRTRTAAGLASANPVANSGTYSLVVTDTTSPAPTVTGVQIIQGNTCCPPQKGRQQQYTAVVNGTNNPPQDVLWRIVSNTSDPRTRINAKGELIINALEDVNPIVIRAISAFDNRVFQDFSVTVDNEKPSFLITASSAIQGRATGGGWHADGCDKAVLRATATTPGYVFEGWYNELNVKVSGDEEYTLPAITGTRTFTARFEQGHIVTWNAGGGTPAPRQVGVINGGTIAAPAAISRGERFKFDGWFRDAAFTIPATFPVTNVTAAVTFWAKWTELQPPQVSTVTLAGAGAGSTGGGDYEDGQTVFISAGTPPPNQQFKEWTTASPGVTLANRFSSSTTFIMPRNNVTITAVWEPLQPIVESIEISPGNTDVQRGTSFGFRATVLGKNDPNQFAVIWSVTGGASSETQINATTGQLTVGADEEGETLLTVTATSTDNPLISDSVTVTVKAGVVTVTIDSVKITPNEATMRRGSANARQFNVAVSGTNAPQSVTWGVTGGVAGGGTSITSSGILTIGTNETATTLTVTAISTADITKTDTATITVFDPLKILESITQPASITGIINGVPKTAVGLGLPSTVAINTNGGSEVAAVTWNVAASSYDPNNKNAQSNILIAGTVNTPLPSGIANPNNVSLAVSVSVSVNSAGVGAPTITPSGTGNSRTITLTPPAGTPAGATIRYTTTATNPTATSGTLYSAPFSINLPASGSITVRAVVVVNGVASPVATRELSRDGGGGGDGPGGGTPTEARTITFNLQGGNINGNAANITRTTQDTGILAANQRPANPTRAGFTFDGWYTAATGGSERNLTSFVFQANTTLHAQWTAVSNGVLTTRPNDFAVPAATINAINNNIPKHMLRINSTGNFTLNAGTTVVGQQAVLVRYNTTTRQLEFVTGAKVGTNGNATLNITQTGDYLALVFKTGDITGTGAVDTSDALALLRHVAGISKFNSIQLYVANGKVGEVATSDALNILRLVAGVIKEIP